MTNPFLSHGEETERKPRLAPMPRAQKEAVTKVREERSDLHKQYEAMTRCWFANVLNCPEGPRVRAMIDWIETLGPKDADELVETVAEQDWLLNALKDVRFAALRLINEQIGRIRKSAGRHELDDPVDGEHAPQIIKNILSHGKGF